MVKIGQSGSIQAKVVVFGKVVAFGLSGCIRARWLSSDKSGCVRAKVVVIGQSGCIWAKMVVFGKVVLFGQSSLIRAKVVVIG